MSMNVTDQQIFEYAQIAGDSACDLTKTEDGYTNEKTAIDYEKWTALDQATRDVVRSSILDSRKMLERSSMRLRELTQGWE